MANNNNNCSWSSENAAKVLINTLKMEKKSNSNDPNNLAEFISALAASNNAQLILTTITNSTPPALLQALLTATNQTGGRLVCAVVPGSFNTDLLKLVVGSTVDFVAGKDLRSTLIHEEADFVVVDCGGSESYTSLLHCMEQRDNKPAVLVGYDAFRQGMDLLSGGDVRNNTTSNSSTHLLPIEKGLLVTRIGAQNDPQVQQQQQRRRRYDYEHHGDRCTNNRLCDDDDVRTICQKSHNWIVKVDKCTGEEHFFRVRSSSARKIAA